MLPPVFLDLSQHNSFVQTNILLDVLFTNINILSVSVSNFPIVTSDYYHPLLSLDFKLTYCTRPSRHLCIAGTSNSCSG
jgi:hypothetical protein